MSLLVQTAVSTAKPIRAGSRKQALDGLTENLHQGHQHQDNPLLAEVGQIWIVIAHHASEAQQGRITIRTLVTPAAETEVLVVVEGQEVAVAGVVAAGVVAAEVAAAEVAAVEGDNFVLKVEDKLYKNHNEEAWLNS